MMDHQALKGGQKTRSKAVHTITHDKSKTMGEMKFKAIIPHTQHIKHFSCSHDLEDQQDLPQQNVDTLSPTQTDQNQPLKPDCHAVRRRGGIFGSIFLSPFGPFTWRINVLRFLPTGPPQWGHS
jgi:hypothetical protein